jgi:hypothetical protein
MRGHCPLGAVPTRETMEKQQPAPISFESSAALFYFIGLNRKE